MDWILQRAKAFVALLAPAITTAILKAFEGATGFDIPGEWEISIISLVTGIFVHQTPNKPA